MNPPPPVVVFKCARIQKESIPFDLYLTSFPIVLLFHVIGLPVFRGHTVSRSMINITESIVLLQNVT
jgi:hypothetical protein